jgi:hypothetical protein
MASPTVYAVSGDTNRTIGVVLYDDGVAVDLTTVDAIECHLLERSSGVLETVSGLTGSAAGEVATTVPGPLVAGTYWLEWQVTAGSTITTYPGSGGTRPVLAVREEAD